jgi:hypothetical protein
MNTKSPSKPEELSILDEVRLWKEEHAAEYDYDIQAIGKALQDAQKEHPERIVSFSKPVATPLPRPAGP